jgi:hypothetical protein
MHAGMRVCVCMCVRAVRACARAQAMAAREGLTWLDGHVTLAALFAALFAAQRRRHARPGVLTVQRHQPEQTNKKERREKIQRDPGFKPE